MGRLCRPVEEDLDMVFAGQHGMDHGCGQRFGLEVRDERMERPVCGLDQVVSAGHAQRDLLRSQFASGYADAATGFPRPALSESKPRVRGQRGAGDDSGRNKAGQLDPIVVESG
jgi:hypothetical protein